MSKETVVKMVGRKTREQRGLPAVKNTTVQVECSVKKACKKKYGSYANAMRFAATFKGTIPTTKEILSEVYASR